MVYNQQYSGSDMGKIGTDFFASAGVEAIGIVGFIVFAIVLILIIHAIKKK